MDRLRLNEELPRRSGPALAGSVLAPILLACLLYLAGLTTFWGGFLFILTAEAVRWLVVLVYPTPPGFRPLVDLMGITLAPLFSLLILMWMPEAMFNWEVRDDLLGAALIYILYLPYAVASAFLLPAALGRR